MPRCQAQRPQVASSHGRRRARAKAYTLLDKRWAEGWGALCFVGLVGVLGFSIGNLGDATKSEQTNRAPTHCQHFLAIHLIWIACQAEMTKVEVRHHPQYIPTNLSFRGSSYEGCIGSLMQGSCAFYEEL